jgi:hypothetical protein
MKTFLSPGQHLSTVPGRSAKYCYCCYLTLCFSTYHIHTVKNPRFQWWISKKSELNLPSDFNPLNRKFNLIITLISVKNDWISR